MVHHGDKGFGVLLDEDSHYLHRDSIVSSCFAKLQAGDDSIGIAPGHRVEVEEFAGVEVRKHRRGARGEERVDGTLRSVVVENGLRSFQLAGFELIGLAQGMSAFVDAAEQLFPESSLDPRDLIKRKLLSCVVGVMEILIVPSPLCRSNATVPPALGGSVGGEGTEWPACHSTGVFKKAMDCFNGMF